MSPAPHGREGSISWRARDSLLVMTASRIALALPLVAVLTFAGGYGLGALQKGAARGGEVPGKMGSCEGLPKRTPPVTSLVRTEPVSSHARAVVDIAHDRRLGLFTKLRAYLRLANSTAPEGLPDLLRQLERELPEDLGRDALVKTIARRWANEDPQAAFAALLAGDPRTLANAEGEIAEVLVLIGREKAFEMALEQPSVSRRGHFLALLLRSLGAVDPVGALERIAALEAPLQYHQELGGVLQGLSGLGSEAALKAIEKLPSALLPGGFYRDAFQSLAEQDPEFARQEFAKMRGLDQRLEIAQGMAVGLSATGLAEVCEWVETLPTTAERDAATSSYLRELAAVSPQEAAAEVAALRSPNQRAATAPQVAIDWYRLDPDAAFEWATDGLEGRSRELAMGRLLDNFGAEMDFDKQRSLADKLPGEGRQKRNFARRWAGSEPEAAADWALRQEGASGALLGAVLEHWAADDIEAANAYVRGIADEELRATAGRVIGPLKEGWDGN